MATDVLTFEKQKDKYFIVILCILSKRNVSSLSELLQTANRFE